jgi:hypothetical protein
MDEKVAWVLDRAMRCQKSAQIQGLLCEKDQLAGYAGSTAMQIGLEIK